MPDEGDHSIIENIAIKFVNNFEQYMFEYWAGVHMYVPITYISGFHTEGGGGGMEFPNPPPPPSPTEILKIEYGYYCFVTGIKQQSCLRLCQKQSERI